MMRKFRFEAETLRTLRHPHICFFFDTCLIRGAPAIVLELIDGGTLGEYLGLGEGSKPGPGGSGRMAGVEPAHKASADMGVERHRVAREGASGAALLNSIPSSGRWGAILSSELLQLASDMASGLHYLHMNGISHRDIKNSNVMVVRGRPARAKLCDFGISALKSATGEPMSRTFSSIGTMRYQAPEASKIMLDAPDRNVPRDRLDTVHAPSIDVYSYGLVLYEITHGIVAFQEATAFAAMVMAMDGERPQMALRPEHSHLGEIIEACWNAEVHLRPSMETVVQALSIAGTSKP